MGKGDGRGSRCGHAHLPVLLNGVLARPSSPGQSSWPGKRRRWHHEPDLAFGLRYRCLCDSIGRHLCDAECLGHLCGCGVGWSAASEITAEGVKRALAALPVTIAKNMTKSGVPGVAIAVVYAGKVRYAEGFGLRQVGRAGDVTADSVFAPAYFETTGEDASGLSEASFAGPPARIAAMPVNAWDAQNVGTFVRAGKARSS